MMWFLLIYTTPALAAFCRFHNYLLQRLSECFSAFFFFCSLLRGNNVGVDPCLTCVPSHWMPVFAVNVPSVSPSHVEFWICASVVLWAPAARWGREKPVFDHSECVSLSVSVCAVMFCRLVVDVPLESRTNVQDVPGSIKNRLIF